MTEPRWFKRGVKEAIYIRALHSSLNRDGGSRYNLPPVWDNIINKKVTADKLRMGVGLVINISHNVPNNIGGKCKKECMNYYDVHNQYGDLGIARDIKRTTPDYFKMSISH